MNIDSMTFAFLGFWLVEFTVQYIQIVIKVLEDVEFSESDC